VPAAQQERDHETAETAVPVQERVDRLKLNVDERCLDQHRQVGAVLVQKDLQGPHALHHLLRWGRHEHSVPRARAADPVLAPAELSRLLLTAPALCEQHFVNLADQPERQRQALAQAPEAMIHCGHVTGNFRDILERHAGRLGALIQKKVGE
jgi:hypothetical protein